MNKQSNAIALGSYAGLLGACLFLFDTIVSSDHLLLAVHFVMLYVSSIDQSGLQVIQLLIVTLVSLLASAAMNLSQELKLKEMAEIVNSNGKDHNISLWHHYGKSIQ